MEQGGEEGKVINDVKELMYWNLKEKVRFKYTSGDGGETGRARESESHKLASSAPGW